MAYTQVMFENLLNRLLAPAPEILPNADARLALSALMVRLARADGHYDAEEHARIMRILSRRYDLDDAGAEMLCAKAEGLEAEAPDTVRFTRAIKEAVPFEARTEIIEALWQVALADGAREAHEDALIRLVASLLGLTDQQSARARQKVTPG